MSRQASPAAFRNAVSRFTTGVTVIAARRSDGQVVGMTANSFTSISLSPPTVLVSLANGRTLSAIAVSERFAINVLPASSRHLSDHFSGRAVPGLVPAFDDVDGGPKLTDAIAYFDCILSQSLQVADHTLLISTVRNCSYIDAEPLVFFSSQYRNLGSASAASTHVKE